MSQPTPLQRMETAIGNIVTSEDLQIQKLYEALKAADYYIERLERVQQRKVVRDMTEAMEYYRRTGPPLIAAYERSAS